MHTVLIAEKSRELTDKLQRAFRYAGCHVCCVSDGDLAIQWLDSHPLPSVVIVGKQLDLYSNDAVLRHLYTLDPLHTVASLLVINELDHSPLERSNPADYLLQSPLEFHKLVTFALRLVVFKLNRPYGSHTGEEAHAVP
jgi:DNA-binding response OmpR family regulator